MEELIPNINKELGTKDEFEKGDYSKEMGGTNELKTYHLYLKSHCDAPDWESECEASSKDEAADIWLQQLSKYEWDRETLLANIEEI